MKLTLDTVDARPETQRSTGVAELPDLRWQQHLRIDDAGSVLEQERWAWPAAGTKGRAVDAKAVGADKAWLIRALNGHPDPAVSH